MKRVIALGVLAAALLAGCAAPRERVIVRPEAVDVPTYIRAPIPPELLAPATVLPPDGLCWRAGERVLCNGQLAALALDYSEALDRCNAQLQAIAGMQP